jgi:hypothetical protein
MKQSSELRVRSLEIRLNGSAVNVRRSAFGKSCKKILLLFTMFFLMAFSLQPLAYSSDKWPGVDESVVEKYAQEQGREAKAPLINTDQGDLLLFVFLLAGAGGGFVAGYYWRMLIAEKASKLAGEKEELG